MSTQELTPESARRLNDLGVACHHSNYSEAQEHYRRAISTFQKTLGPTHPYTATALNNLAALLRRMKLFHEGEAEFQRALRIWKRPAPVLPGQQAPLEAEHYDGRGILTEFGAHVRELRARVEASSMEARAELEGMIQRMGPWYHNVSYAGVMTNPATPDYPASRWRLLDQLIPQDLHGKKVLDIGCNSGSFAMEMKKRGAERVVGIDVLPHVTAQARFTSHWFAVPFEVYELSAYDVEWLDEIFDIVLFTGVLYHLKHPLYALEKISNICRDTMYFQSVVRSSAVDFEPESNYPGNEVAVFDRPDYPRLFFIEKSYNGDDTNWWFATRNCLKAMARVSGFKTVENTDDPEYLVCRKNPST